MVEHFLIALIVYLWVAGGILVALLLVDIASGDVVRLYLVAIVFLWPFILLFSTILAVKDGVMTSLRRKLG